MFLHNIALYLASLLALPATFCEQYTSVDELSRWAQEIVRLTDRLDELIHQQESRLNDLRRARDSILPLKKEVETRLLVDPVQIFVILNRLLKTIEVVEQLPREDWLFTITDHGTEQMFDLDLSNTRDEYREQVEEDLRGSGVAVLRLQAFYGLNTTHLIAGSIIPEESIPFKMNAEDCYRLGKIAYQDGQYGPSIVWLHASLELAIKEKDDDRQMFDGSQLIDYVLDHMAFAAYKLNLLEYAIKLTQVWLNRDPENERARENLEYYLDESASRPEKDLISRTENLGRTNDSQAEEYFKNYRDIAFDSYQVEEDEVVRRLCRQSGLTVDTRNKCHIKPAALLGGHFHPEIRMETLNEDPKIVRFFDILSTKEAEHLRRISKPKLQRSTIMLSNRQQSSDFRIAKTAWLESNSDAIVRRLEERLTTILGLNMEESELLQVVNYGLGGFYGPHLDTARASNASGNDSVLMEQLKRSDRYATILIYLNDVHIGGSTVFPLLNLTVPPVRLSAIVWFNILESGYSDERTLHTGCPVSLGSKWVAVKWPREMANSFSRGGQWWYRSK